MKKYYLLAVTLSVSLIRCSSLPSTIEERVHAGDPYSHVREALGVPPSMEGDKNGGVVAYWDSRDICQIYFDKTYRVIRWECQRNPNYVNPVAAIFSGMGQGLQNSSSRSINCTTTGGSGFYNTNCH